MDKIKTCTICGISFPNTTDYFYKKRSKCKACYKKEKLQYNETHKEQKKEYYESHKERHKELMKCWRENNKEQIKEQTKQYYENNKEQKREYYKNRTNHRKEYEEQYRKNHKEINSDYQKQYREKNKTQRNQYYEKNKDKIYLSSRLSDHRRKAFKKQLPKNYTIAEWNICIKHFLNQCAYCGKVDNLTQDHFIPLSKCGEYTINNIIPVCKSCNSSKSNKDFFEWYPKQEFYSKKREQKILKYLNYDPKTKMQQLALTI